MKRVYQTKFGPEHNALQACIASIFEVELDQVPNFNVPPHSEFRERMNQWLKPYSMGHAFLSLGDSLAPSGYYLLYGNSPRAKQELTFHYVVAYNDGRIIHYAHDPHPEGGHLVAEGILVFTHAFLNYPVLTSDMQTMIAAILNPFRNNDLDPDWGIHTCNHCYQTGATVETITHLPDCVVLVARRYK